MVQAGIVAAISVLLLASAASADPQEAALPAHCLNTETASINMQLQEFDKDPATLRAKYNAELREIKDLARASGMSRMEVGGSNYSISPQPDNSYALNANINFYTAPAEEALDLLSVLRQNKYPARLSFVTTNGVTGHISNKCRLIIATGQWE